MYGPEDNESNLVSYVIKGCLNNTETLNLTAGEQQRDFIYVEDVVSAYVFLLSNLNKITENYTEYELGCGQSISLRQFVETIQSITNSQTQLNFGAIPYRDHEIMHSQANIQPLQKLGWSPQWNLETGLKKTIDGFSYQILFT